MKSVRRKLVWLLLLTVVTQFVPPANACGPESIEPIFVFRNSPDPPFHEFVRGNIGILKPTFGRKTLTIAYRLLNGSVFNGEEQLALIEALKGSAPEEDDQEIVRAWIEARKTVDENESELPEIYRDRKNSGYDFFPNCTSNAFQVAIETLKDRANRFGSHSPDVRDWLEAQDVVFRNCAEGALRPKPVGAERPVWLQKDREYQTAAALFYSQRFEDARQRFEQIAQDVESDWQQTADYLVARTLVRQASLESNETTKRTLYESAETYLTNLVPRANRFRGGSKKLLALVKYRLHPEERVRELAQVLSEQSGNDNLRQDVIDYVWLLDKFDRQIQTAEAERQKQLNPQKPESQVAEAGTSNVSDTQRAEWEQKRREWEQTYAALQRGEVIQIYFYPKKPTGELDYSGGENYVFKPDVSAAEILQTVEGKLGRKLTPEELKTLNEGHEQALITRKFWLSPNRKIPRGGEYEGCDYQCNGINLDQLPSFLTADSLSDWIFTFQSNDQRAYTYALEKWHESHSTAWFVAALEKANKNSRSLKQLMIEAEKVQPDTAMFTSVAYHRIRLYNDLGQRSDARRLLDELIASRFETLPASAQNQLLELRMELAQNLSDFLRFSTRVPAAFYEYGVIGRIGDILNNERVSGEMEDGDQERVEELLAWDKRAIFDEKSAELLNWHLATAQLLEAAHDPALPDYLRRRMLLTIWTRAVLLKQDDSARKAAIELIEKGEDASGLFQSYLQAVTQNEREHAAIFILLRWPNLSPYIDYGIQEKLTSSEEADYYLELSWWCTLSDKNYDENGNELPKIVNAPSFLSAEALSEASRERKALIAIGDGKQFLGRKVLEWARRKPTDPRLPEALFIASKANESYRYGCAGWDQDQDLRRELVGILVKSYRGSPWAAKLDEPDQ